jgi:hypothetical protein
MKRAISGLNEGIVLGLTKGFRGFGAEADAEAYKTSRAKQPVDNSRKRVNGEQALTGSPSLDPRSLETKIHEASRQFNERISNRHAQIALYVGCSVHQVLEVLGAESVR